MINVYIVVLWSIVESGVKHHIPNR